MARKLEGKVAIVTGAGTSGSGWGTGKATAVLLAREGVRLMLFDRNAAACAETAATITSEGGAASCETGDVASAADLRHLIDACIAQFGRLDILINNVGITAGRGLLEESEEGWDRVMAVNARSVFLAAKYAVPHMLNQGAGRIVNIASTAGIRVVAMPPSYGYSASKAAVSHMTRAMAIEFAARGIRCNCIVPGMLDTANVRTAYAGVGFSPEAVEEQMRRRDLLSPTGKQGDAWDVAHAALFLVSEEAKYINGAELVIDGGLTTLVPI